MRATLAVLILLSGLFPLAAQTVSPLSRPEVRALESVPRRARECVQILQQSRKTLQESDRPADRERARMLGRAEGVFPLRRLQEDCRLPQQLTPDRTRTLATRLGEMSQEVDATIGALLPVGEKALPADAPRPQRRQRLARLVVPQLLWMRQAQKDVHAALLPISRAIQARPDRRPTDREKEQLKELAQSQKLIVQEAHLLQILQQREEEKPPFLEVMRQVQLDLARIEQRLASGRLDPLTAVIARDVEDTLQELSEAHLQLGRLKPTETSIGRPLSEGLTGPLTAMLELRTILLQAIEALR